jgi:hypothetical protein
MRVQTFRDAEIAISNLQDQISKLKFPTVQQVPTSSPEVIRQVVQQVSGGGSEIDSVLTAGGVLHVMEHIFQGKIDAEGGLALGIPVPTSQIEDPATGQLRGQYIIKMDDQGYPAIFGPLNQEILRFMNDNINYSPIVYCYCDIVPDITSGSKVHRLGISGNGPWNELHLSTWDIVSDIIPTVANAYNIGNSSHRIKKLWANDLDLVNALPVSSGGTGVGTISNDGTTLVFDKVGPPSQLLGTTLGRSGPPFLLMRGITFIPSTIQYKDWSGTNQTFDLQAATNVSWWEPIFDYGILTEG